MGPSTSQPSGTREASFLQASTAAGVAHTMTRACAAATVPGCSCDAAVATRRTRRADFQWGGCSHDVVFGAKFRFLMFLMI